MLSVCIKSEAHNDLLAIDLHELKHISVVEAPLSSKRVMLVGQLQSLHCEQCATRTRRCEQYVLPPAAQ
jgi:hypothetical protein